jgi:hypothetical protein
VTKQADTPVPNSELADELLINSTPQGFVSADRESIDDEARRDLAPKG